MGLFNRIINSYRYEPRKQLGKYKVVEMSKGRIAPSVDDFITAAEAAGSKIMQSRITLYNHYQQTLLFDNHVNALIKKRLENITNKTIALFNGEHQVDGLADFFTAPRFRSYIQDLLFSNIFWGMGLFTFDANDYKGKKWFDYHKIPEKHINPYRREVLIYQNDSTGIPFENDDTAMFVGDEDNLGLLLQVTLLSLYRRLGMFNYGKYVDLASENFMQLRIREFADSEGLSCLQSQLQKRDSGGLLSLPDGAEVQAVNQSSSQQNQLFENYLKMLKEEMAVLILGQTMTTEDGSSRSQAEVHELEQAAKYTSDEKLILDILNYDFIDKLPLWDIDVKPEMKFRFIDNSDNDIRRQINNLTVLKNLGLELTSDELKEKFKDII